MVTNKFDENSCLNRLLLEANIHLISFSDLVSDRLIYINLYSTGSSFFCVCERLTILLCICMFMCESGGYICYFHFDCSHLSLLVDCYLNRKLSDVEISMCLLLGMLNFEYM